jgi:protein-S-isoprenylcysteine O-methyltransferase Ste14
MLRFGVWLAIFRLNAKLIGGLMAFPIAQLSLAGGSGPSPRWTQFANFIVRRRVAISLVGFIVLIAEDVLSGTKPHSLINLAEHHAAWGLALVLAGLGIRSWAAGTLHKWAELTTVGPYGIVRHPLYLGSFLMMIGFCTIIDDGENILFVLGPILAIYVFAMLREEGGLAQRFPNQWPDFAKRVPRFLPRRLPVQPFAAWSGRQWLANREYQAVLASLTGLVALQLWHLA